MGLIAAAPASAVAAAACQRLLEPMQPEWHMVDVAMAWGVSLAALNLATGRPPGKVSTMHSLMCLAE